MRFLEDPLFLGIPRSHTDGCSNFYFSVLPQPGNYNTHCISFIKDESFFLYQNSTQAKNESIGMQNKPSLQKKWRFKLRQPTAEGNNNRDSPVCYLTTEGIQHDCTLLQIYGLNLFACDLPVPRIQKFMHNLKAFKPTFDFTTGDHYFINPKQVCDLNIHSNDITRVLENSASVRVEQKLNFTCLRLMLYSKNLSTLRMSKSAMLSAMNLTITQLLIDYEIKFARRLIKRNVEPLMFGMNC